MTQYFNRLNLIFMALMSVQVGFLFFVVFKLQEEGPLNPDQSEVFIYGAIAAGIGAILSSRFLKRKLLEQVKNTNDPAGKKMRYMTSFLIQMVIPEFAVLFSTIAYWMSGDQFVLGIILVLLIMEGAQKPGPNKFKLDLGMSDLDYQAMDSES